MYFHFYILYNNFLISFLFFRIHINDQKYKVVPPKRERIQVEDLNKLGDIKALVAQVSSINVLIKQIYWT